MWFSAFFYLWICAFLMAATSYVLIVGVANWYFKAERKDEFSTLTGVWWLFRYNLGSVLFGSFLIALIEYIRLIFEYVNKKF